MRAKTSVPPPGANAITKRIGFVGYDCAYAVSMLNSAAQIGAIAHNHRFIVGKPPFPLFS
jgi:hypothetical protein